MAEKILNHGEISLAHNGVLFLDEILEFNRETLNTLRSPLEDRKITLNRHNTTITYPSNFILLASTNPCPCGYYGSTIKECTCSANQISKYLNKLSGPLLDRIDIHVEVTSVKYGDLTTERKSETSNEIKSRVNKAKEIQLTRYKNENINSNAELSSNLIKKYCKLTNDCQLLLNQAFDSLNLSVRAYERILKLARTIADLEESKEIKINHLAEAIQYRSLDRKYWS